MIFALTIGLAGTVGYNRLSKIGCLIALIGTLSIILLPHIIYNNADIVGLNYQALAESNNLYFQFLKFGLSFIVLGVLLLFISSGIRVWENRQKLFPFLFKRANLRLE